MAEKILFVANFCSGKCKDLSMDVYSDMTVETFSNENLKKTLTNYYWFYFATCPLFYKFWSPLAAADAWWLADITEETGQYLFQLTTLFQITITWLKFGTLLAHIKAYLWFHLCSNRVNKSWVIIDFQNFQMKSFVTPTD